MNSGPSIQEHGHGQSAETAWFYFRMSFSSLLRQPGELWRHRLDEGDGGTMTLDIRQQSPLSGAPQVSECIAKPRYTVRPSPCVLADPQH